LKPILMIGLGNPLVGDDGIGAALVDELARSAEWSRRADFMAGGCDLLRLADTMVGREVVVVIDAVLGDAAPGTVSVHVEPFGDFETCSGSAHELSAIQAIGLLKTISPRLRDTPFVLVAVAVRELRHEASLADRLPEVSRRVHAALGPALRGRSASGLAEPL